MSTITYADIKDLIPKYKGEPNKLEEVIQTNDAIYAQMTDGVDKKIFHFTVKTRLTERAFDAIKTVADTSTWPLVLLHSTNKSQAVQWGSYKRLRQQGRNPVDKSKSEHGHLKLHN